MKNEIIGYILLFANTMFFMFGIRNDWPIPIVAFIFAGAVAAIQIIFGG